MNSQFDHRHIRRAFSRSAAGYDAVAVLQHEVEKRLLESLDYLGDRAPKLAVDVGSGPGHAAATMHKRWPKAQVIALDLAMGMLRQTRVNTAGRLPAFLDFARRPEPVCADVARLST